MLFKKKKREIEPELPREDMVELVDENIKFAEKYASEGNVSGMEMALEIVAKYSQKIGRKLETQKTEKIKLIGYERGEKALKERAMKLQKEGKIREAQNAIKLANAYGNEAKMLRLTIN